MKIEARILELWLDMSSEPKWPKCSFSAPDPKIKQFFKISLLDLSYFSEEIEDLIVKIEARFVELWHKI